MDYKKLRQEKASFLILFFVSLAIFLTSALFIKEGIEGSNPDNELAYIIGGALFLFFSAYSMIIFIRRINRANLATKVGDIMLYDRVRSVKQIAENLNKPAERIEKSINFLINNDYIQNFKVDGDVIFNKTEDLVQKRLLQERLISLTDRVTEIARDYQSVKAKKKKTLNSCRCSGCGANVVFGEEQAICPYCGNLLKSKSQD